MDPRVTELLELVAAERLQLPYPPETILALEDAGAIVNLRTGAIYPGQADQPVYFRLTVIGEAVATVLAAERRVQP